MERREEVRQLAKLKEQVTNAGVEILEKGALCLLAASLLRHGVLDAKKHATLLSLVLESDVAVVRALRTYTERGPARVADVAARKQRQGAANDFVDCIAERGGGGGASKSSGMSMRSTLSAAAAPLAAAVGATASPSLAAAAAPAAAAAAPPATKRQHQQQHTMQGRGKVAQKQHFKRSAMRKQKQAKMEQTSRRRTNKAANVVGAKAKRTARTAAAVAAAAERPRPRPRPRKLSQRRRRPRDAALAETQMKTVVKMETETPAKKPHGSNSAPPVPPAVLGVLLRLAESRQLQGIASGVTRTKLESLEVALVASDLEMRAT